MAARDRSRSPAGVALPIDDGAAPVEIPTDIDPGSGSDTQEETSSEWSEPESGSESPGMLRERELAEAADDEQAAGIFGTAVGPDGLDVAELLSDEERWRHHWRQARAHALRIRRQWLLAARRAAAARRASHPASEP